MMTNAGQKLKNPKNLSLQKRMAKHGYVFASPFIIGFLVIFIPIIIDSIRLSFNELDITADPYILNFVGLSNYKYALQVDPDYLRLAVTTVLEMIPQIIVVILFSLFVANILNRKMKGRTVFRAIFFLPIIISMGIVERADMSNEVFNFINSADSVFGDSGGAELGIQSLGGLSQFFQNSALNTQLTDFIMQVVRNIYTVVNQSGVQILLFIAGLQSISPSVYEAASIEGCTGWESFWKITFPIISPVILVNVIYSVIDSFTRADNPIMVKIQSLPGMQGVGNAMAWIYFVMIAVMLALIFLISTRLVFYQQKD